MCGISGWVDFEHDQRQRAGELRSMTVSMAPRGPDASGTWLSREAAIGHRRLTVIDPDGGGQPMTYTDPAARTVVLTYSGEVYNYRELRAELAATGHVFTTESDTEVVLRAYVQWGEQAPRRLAGMFAFAVWDERSAELTLVRDHLGIKPLYYQRCGAGLIFGSEPKAIFASGAVPAEIDADGMRELLSLARTPGCAVFRGMREVPPGHVARFGRDGLTVRRYWALEAAEHTDDDTATTARVRQLLEQTVSQQLTADVPLGALLGGGLDSSALVALAQRERLTRRAEPLRTFTVSFRGAREGGGLAGRAGGEGPMPRVDDTPYVRDVVAATGVRHTDIMLAAEALLSADTWTATLAARDFPPLGDMDSSLYLLARAIKPYATVVLSGEGADELFGGYPWFHDTRSVATATFPWLALTRSMGRHAVFEPRLVRQLDMTAYQADSYADALKSVPVVRGETGVERRMREISYLHLTRFLPIPLDRKDRMAMAAGVEVRVPYCDYRLVEYVFNAPWRLKAEGGREKSLLRAAVADLVPESVRLRPKNPYPAVADPAYHARLRAAVTDLLHDPHARAFEMLSRPGVRALAAMPPAGTELVRLGLERVLRLDAWLRRYQVRITW
jgi:asparagine synthase (glutamine-hydrolysing)